MQQTHRSLPAATGVSSRAAWRVLAASLLLAASACTMNDSQERVAGGAAIGAIAGSLLGTSRQSAAIGAAVGAAGGYLYDQHEKRDDADTENERLRRENERLRLEAENSRLQQEMNQ